MSYPYSTGFRSTAPFMNTMVLLGAVVPRETKYVALEDGRKLCLECLDSAIMDTNQCQPLYLDIQEFYEGLNIKVEQQVPLLLVERQALNEAMDGEKSGHHHMPETRGLCLSEEQTVSTVRMFARLWNSCMKDTEVFVEHVLSIHIEANMYVQVPQLRTFRLLNDRW
ncbi:hypothetical protein RHMOL_Rhmol04G0185300 [Rhododendron molle]|uniref:Uncharacterized protein n=1 Tax=Rhododendron molle TaxID=49168 RepID=A0ACC0P349_RHOML|nr:hypothetical protein RHMOL_Rhmol04G0185300 [Rhododendron molle]